MAMRKGESRLVSPIWDGWRFNMTLTFGEQKLSIPFKQTGRASPARCIAVWTNAYQWRVLGDDRMTSLKLAVIGLSVLALAAPGAALAQRTADPARADRSATSTKDPAPAATGRTSRTATTRGQPSSDRPPAAERAEMPVPRLDDPRIRQGGRTLPGDMYEPRPANPSALPGDMYDGPSPGNRPD
jgi:hypothetical protein